jgi:large subunit ribosomal protein L2
MGIKKFKPTSAGTRFRSGSDYADITVDSPHKPLTSPMKKRCGRNSHGRVTSFQRGGGNKRLYRAIDFKRDKYDVPAKVQTIEYDPNRSARIALIFYVDGEKRYILAPEGLKTGDRVMSGENVEVALGNALPLKSIPVGTIVHNVEMKPGCGGKLARAAGASVQIVAKEGGYAQLKLTSGEIRLIGVECMASVGKIGNAEHDGGVLTLGGLR